MIMSRANCFYTFQCGSPGRRTRSGQKLRRRAPGGEAGQAVVCGCQSGRQVGRQLYPSRAFFSPAHQKELPGLPECRCWVSPAIPRLRRWRPCWGLRLPAGLVLLTAAPFNLHLLPPVPRTWPWRSRCLFPALPGQPAGAQVCTPDSGRRGWHARACGAAAGVWARRPPWGAALLPPGGALQRPDV